MKMTDGLFLDCSAEDPRRGIPQHRVRRADHRRRLHEARPEPRSLRRAADGKPLRRPRSAICAPASSAVWASSPAPTSATKPPSSKPSTAPPPTSPAKASPTPSPLIMSGVMMLNHIHEDAAAQKVQAAYDAILREGKTLTRDLGGTANTAEFTDAIIGKMK